MMLGLRQFRSQIHGVSDFLPYAALITPDVILCKDGSFLAGFFMRGQDSASCTADELAFISAQFNNAIKLLGSGWMLHALCFICCIQIICYAACYGYWT